MGLGVGVGGCWIGGEGEEWVGREGVLREGREVRGADG